jgi:hypothetical protein
VKGRLVQKLRKPSWFGAAQESIWVFGVHCLGIGFWVGGGRVGGGRGSGTSIERVSVGRDADGNVYTLHRVTHSVFQSVSYPMIKYILQ